MLRQMTLIIYQNLPKSSWRPLTTHLCLHRLLTTGWLLSNRSRNLLTTHPNLNADHGCQMFLQITLTLARSLLTIHPHQRVFLTITPLLLSNRSRNPLTIPLCPNLNVDRE